MKFRARVEGDKVLMIFDDRTFIELGWKEAGEMSAILRNLSKQAEEVANVERLIQDGAILDRLGIPVGLTSNPKIQGEIRKEAQHNRDLRRYLPSIPSVHSKEVFGTPTITQTRA